MLKTTRAQNNHAVLRKQFRVTFESAIEKIGLDILRKWIKIGNSAFLSSLLTVFLCSCAFSNVAEIEVEYPESQQEPANIGQRSTKSISVRNFEDKRTNKKIAHHYYGGAAVGRTETMNDSRDLGPYLRGYIKNELAQEGYNVNDINAEYIINADLIILTAERIHDFWHPYYEGESHAKFTIIDPETKKALSSKVQISTVQHKKTYVFDQRDPYAEAAGLALRQVIIDYIQSDELRKVIQ